MTYKPPETQGNFVPPNIILPDSYEEAKRVLTDYLIRVAEGVNARELAQYQDASINASGENISDTVTGQAWFVPGDANKFRYGSRTVVNFGALPKSTTKSADHGISVTNDTIFTRIQGTASVPGTTFIPVPYANTAGNPVEVWVDATKVYVRTNADYSSYTQCFIVLEWINGV